MIKNHFCPSFAHKDRLSQSWKSYYNRGWGFCEILTAIVINFSTFNFNNNNIDLKPFDMVFQHHLPLPLSIPTTFRDFGKFVRRKSPKIFYRFLSFFHMKMQVDKTWLKSFLPELCPLRPVIAILKKLLRKICPKKIAENILSFPFVFSRENASLGRENMIN